MFLKKENKCSVRSRYGTLSLLLIFGSFLSFAQPVLPSDWGLKRFVINDKKLGPIGFYIDTTHIKRKAPILVYAHGSGGYPFVILVQKKSEAQIMTTFENNIIPKTSNDYHLVMLDKPGLSFCDTVVTNDINTVMEDYAVPAYYTKTLSLTWRVEAISAVITYLIKNGYHDGTKIIAWGFSEGGQVVPKLAAQDKRITHLVSVVGAGLNQFDDFINASRIKVIKGELTPQQSQDEIDTYMKNFKYIYEDPTSTTKFFEGHTYKRWASFCSDVPLESLVKLTIPIYMLAGSADVNSPIAGLDYVPLEFLRKGKKNLTYEVCVGCDHFQNVIQPSSPDEKGKSRNEEFMTRILEWLARNP
jgi:pimeloyl-ACP methyl ester carboxylesterase